MFSFKEYISESTLLVESKANLSHVEDLIFTNGYNGAKQSIDYLENIVSSLVGHGQKNVSVTTKWDGCIHPDTLIVTNKGNIPIKDIIQSSKSFKTLQYNFDTGMSEMGEIQHPRLNNNNKEWVEIHLENGDIIRTTSDHKFYTTTRGWVEAQNLTEEDNIKESD